MSDETQETVTTPTETPNHGEANAETPAHTPEATPVPTPEPVVEPVAPAPTPEAPAAPVAPVEKDDDDEESPSMAVYRRVKSAFNTLKTHSAAGSAGSTIDSSLQDLAAAIAIMEELIMPADKIQ